VEVAASATNSTCHCCNVEVAQCWWSTQDTRESCIALPLTAPPINAQGYQHCTHLLQEEVQCHPKCCTHHLPWYTTLQGRIMKYEIIGSMAQCQLLLPRVDCSFYLCFVVILLIMMEMTATSFLEADIWYNNCPLCQKLANCCSSKDYSAFFCILFGFLHNQNLFETLMLWLLGFRFVSGKLLQFAQVVSRIVEY